MVRFRQVCRLRFQDGRRRPLHQGHFLWRRELRIQEGQGIHQQHRTRFRRDRNRHGRIPASRQQFRLPCRSRKGPHGTRVQFLVRQQQRLLQGSGKAMFRPGRHLRQADKHLGRELPQAGQISGIPSRLPQGPQGIGRRRMQYSHLRRLHSHRCLGRDISNRR